MFNDSLVHENPSDQAPKHLSRETQVFGVFFGKSQYFFKAAVETVNYSEVFGLLCNTHFLVVYDWSFLSCSRTS